MEIKIVKIDNGIGIWRDSAGMDPCTRVREGAGVHQPCRHGDQAAKQAIRLEHILRMPLSHCVQ